MGNDILLTIAIPNYNYETYISECISSALNIKRKDIEIIVSDNNSSDRSWDIISGFHDERLLMVKQQSNIGLYQNWNYLLRMARGAYFKLLQSDDCFVNNINEILDEKFFDLISNNNFGIITLSEKEQIESDSIHINEFSFRQFELITKFSQPTLNIINSNIGKRYLYEENTMRGDLKLLTNIYWDKNCSNILTIHDKTVYLRKHDRNDRKNYVKFENIKESYELSMALKKELTNNRDYIYNFIWKGSLLSFAILRLIKKYIFNENKDVSNLKYILKNGEWVIGILFIPLFLVGIRKRI